MSHTANLILVSFQHLYNSTEGTVLFRDSEVRGHSARRVQWSRPGLPDSLLYPIDSLNLLMAASRFSGDQTEARACQIWSPKQHLCFQGKGPKISLLPGSETCISVDAVLPCSLNSDVITRHLESPLHDYLCMFSPVAVFLRLLSESMVSHG